MQYKFVGDYAMSLPSHGLDNVQPGDKVDVNEAINHPFFELIKDKKTDKEAN